MLFHSTDFLFLFLPATFAGYLLLAYWRLPRIAITWLSLASLVFYAWWKPPYVGLVLVSILFNYGICAMLHAARKHPAAYGRRFWLGLGVLGNLGALGYFKYANFFISTAGALIGSHFEFGRVILPLAISFFTFTQIAYLVDVANGRAPRYGFLEYAFFVTFFPHLIAGPIVRHGEIMPQVAAEAHLRVAWRNLEVGATIFVIGLFKKMVLADGSAVYATPFFDAVADGRWFFTRDAWVATIAYSFQLYFDFSGYSDMATGLARMFGFRFPINFDAPYRATNIIEFWRRWHITLSRFLRDYLYIPLGGSRGGYWLRYRNLFVTMALGGLWHGAGWTFVIWGMLHGLYLGVNHAVRTASERYLRPGLTASPLATAGGWCLTLFAVLIGWVFFRAADLPTALRVLQMLVGAGPELTQTELHPLGDAFMGPARLIWLAALLAVVLLAPTTHQYMARFEPALESASRPLRWFHAEWRPSMRHGLVLGIMLFFIFRKYFVLAPTAFLYFNF